MPKKVEKNLTDFTVPLYMNSLRGRMLRLPPPGRKKREMLLVYGHHASLERFFGLAESLNDFGGVTMPDLPGFGGMDSFYKIGEKPSLDNLADYLAAFVKLRYRNRRFTIVAVSFGFTVVTRMLQKHPDIAKKTDMLVSVVGFTHYEEFTFSRPRYLAYRYAASIFSRRLTSSIFRNIVLHPTVIRHFYPRTHNAKHKFAGLKAEELRALINFEIRLWRRNDTRTHMDTTVTMLTIDNLKQQIDLPVWHMVVKDDNYFDSHVVEQHMHVIFSDYIELPIKLGSHNVSMISDKLKSKTLIPSKLRAALRTDP